jgi:DNA repair photolyase
LLGKVPSSVALTITTDEEGTAKLLEPHAPLPSARLKAAEDLTRKGIPVSVRIDPVIPFVNDKPEKLVAALASIGVRHVTSSTYKVKPDNWRRFSAAIPDVAEKLKPLYFQQGEKIGGNTLLPKDLRFKLMKNMRDLVASHGMKFGVCREGLSQLNTAPCDGSWLLSAERK